MRSTTSPLADLLALARDRKAAEDRAAADLLVVAARWADLHPPESIHEAATFTVPGCEHEEPIAGDGAPLVAEFCLAELGTVLGISTTSAKKLVGHALELRHRLPRLWAQVQAGRVPAWRARAVAEATIHTTPALTREAAAFVDAQVAAVAGRVGPAQLDRLVAEAIRRFDLAEVDPAADPEDGYLHVDPRHATIHDDDVHFAGTMRMEAELDIADALDVDRVLAHGAEMRKALGSSEPLAARRAKALGDLARTQTALDLYAHGAGARDVDRPAGRPRGRPARPLRRARSTGCPRSSDRPGGWRRASASSSSTRSRTGAPTPAPRSPSSPSSTSTPTCRRRRTRSPTGSASRSFSATATCVFPWCTRPARRGDIDHIDEYDHQAEAEGRPQSGPTRTSNLAALCRFHHRLKTHSAWSYRMTEPGVFEWTSPHGHHYRRDHHGTSPIDPPGPPDVPRPRRP